MELQHWNDNHWPNNSSVPDTPAATAQKLQTDTPPDDDIIRMDSFSFEGYQVVRGEFFDHINEPSVSFNKGKVNFNAACIRRLPHVNYVQFLVNQQEKKLVIRPVGEDVKDGILWCSLSGNKRKPKQITCKIFYMMIHSLMGWNPEYRYKLLGKIIESSHEFLVVFDLNSVETYLRVVKDDGKVRSSRTPVYPADWKGRFGLPAEEHDQLKQVNIFNGYTTFGLQGQVGKNVIMTINAM